ncbi:uncharacterized protein [Amphiura filiformis]|uniref:uncharacterized protein n=1 Tax=Amphiura filiformis TaxID=82378 RepID=UPI003B2214AE
MAEEHVYDYIEKLQAILKYAIAYSRKIPITYLGFVKLYDLKDQQKALAELAKDDNSVVVPADKGKSVVVLNKPDYDSKCKDLLKDEKTYKPVGYNPTSGYRKKVTDFTTKLTTEGTFNVIQKRKLDAPPSEPSVPAFYGLPKIHKAEPIPVRPIVSSIGSITYNLAKYAAEILGPLVGKSPHNIKNTQDFVNQIKGIKLRESETITSYDVSALFICIPPDFAIKVVTECLKNDTTLHERTDLSVDQIVELVVDICLKTTYCSYQGKYYKQQHGCAMGSPVSPIVVNLCMESFEQDALRLYTDTPPRLWLRFVNDTFVVLERSELEIFFHHINDTDENIQFTQELCKDSSLAFLDCLITVKANKKKSQDNQQTNGGGRPTKARATLPFLSGTSERVKKHLKAYGIAASFKPGNTLRGKRVHVKDKQPKEKSSNLVYGLVCAGKDCTESYVGETKQALKSRVKQHRRPSTNEAQNSAVYLHLKECGHSINIEDATILDKGGTVAPPKLQRGYLGESRITITQ